MTQRMLKSNTAKNEGIKSQLFMEENQTTAVFSVLVLLSLQSLTLALAAQLLNKLTFT